MYKLPADADMLIMMTVVESTESRPNFLIGEDMGLLVLLLSHTKQDCRPIFFFFESKLQKTEGRLLDILAAKLKHGDTVYEQSLFLRGFLGCDSTSQIMA